MIKVIKVIPEIVKEVKENPEVLEYSKVSLQNFIYPVTLAAIIGLGLYTGDAFLLNALTNVFLAIALFSIFMWAVVIRLHLKRSKFNGLTKEDIEEYIEACAKFYLLKNNKAAMNITLFNCAVTFAFLSTSSFLVLGIYVFSFLLMYYSVYAYSKMWRMINTIIDDGDLPLV